MNQKIAQNYQNVLNNIKAACLKSGRNIDSVKLMLVTKTVPVEGIKSTIDIGHKMFGENKVQELELKVRELADQNVNFHFIGHLQTNKVKKCLESSSYIHSVDRVAVAAEIQKYLENTDRYVDILIQVNTSNEESKYGVTPEGLIELVKEAALLKNLRIRGLMTLAKFSANENEVRDCFRLLRKLSEQVELEHIPNVEMRELSMGMTSDYQIAIEEGATIVRVGTAIFGKRLTSDEYYWPKEELANE